MNKVVLGGNYLPSDGPLSQLSRRDFLAATGAVAAASFPSPSQNLLRVIDTVGYAYDCMAATEAIIPDPVPILEPRTDVRPAIAPLQTEGVSLISLEFGDNRLLRIPDATSLEAEHTHAKLQADEPYVAAGTGIITTAEGPTDGKQEYCSLFLSEGNQALAIGYEGGFYLFDPTVGRNGGEWVRVVDRSGDGNVPSRVTSSVSWEDMNVSLSSNAMLIQQTVAGTRTLQRLGYKPWPAVLPSTQMPYMEHLTLDSGNCLQSVDDLNGEYTRGYFITERGDLLDANHLQAKAGESLALFAELYYQYLARIKQPQAIIRYSEASAANFVFSVSADSIQPDVLVDTVYSLMTTEGMLMEGVSQRYGVDNSILGVLRPSMGGMNPEDSFSNSLAAIGMLDLIQKYGLMQMFAPRLQAIAKRNPVDFRSEIRTLLQDIKPALVSEVLTNVGQTLGVRKQSTPMHISLPRGMYPLISTKISDSEAFSPTLLSPEAAGIDPQNMRARQYRVLHVPALQAEGERVLEKVES